MYVFLLILGAISAAAGVVLRARGLAFGGREFDGSIITPGAVAIVGGLILIGLAFAVRVLGRIEKALAAWPLSYPVLQEPVLQEPVVQEEAGTGAPAIELPAAAPARIPFPPKPAAEPVAQPAPAAAAARVLPEDAALERLREKFPTLVRLETAPIAQDADVSLSPKPAVRAGGADAGVDPKIRRGRRHGLYALLGRFDRGAAAAGHVALWLDYRTAQSHRAKRVIRSRVLPSAAEVLPTKT